MAGVENITAAILKEAAENAEALISEAEKKAADAEKAARDAADSLCREAEEKAKKDTEAYRERIESRKELNARQAILAAKQEAIENTIEKAFSKLKSQDGEAYFSMVEALLQRNVRPGSGVILFSEEDKNRLPADFEARLQKIARENGGELEMSDASADIDSGFILRYGGIDLNCSLSSIFHEKKSEMQDAARDALFS
ncbi:MAG: V-type ATP synthase subunit E [Lachnospiraceae bacterium]|nr:V-type ATP synthase subunit E [Lachnospiraceae bacterium]